VSDFEFLSVLVSIIIGLGLTHLLSGLGRAFYTRERFTMDAVHVAWTVTVLFVLVLNWWVFLLWRDFEGWTFGAFFAIVMWTTLMYMMAVILYPPNLSGDIDYRQIFEQNRTWFLLTFTGQALLDILVTTQREGQLPELYYLVFVGHFAVITFVGVFVRKRWYDLLAAWYIMVTMVSWSFIVRHTLT
jgi:hypothetical protein